jgi:hypothetical protein
VADADNATWRSVCILWFGGLHTSCEGKTLVSGKKVIRVFRRWAENSSWTKQKDVGLDGF